MLADAAVLGGQGRVIKYARIVFRLSFDQHERETGAWNRVPDPDGVTVTARVSTTCIPAPRVATDRNRDGAGGAADDLPSDANS